MQTLVDPNYFSGLATIITGGVAMWIYFKQKKDSKVQAARVLLMEIRTAEERINQIKEKVQSGFTNDFPSVFPTKNWKTYSHLFISDFDQDEIKAISSFYDYGDLIEEFAKRNNDFFWLTTEERARVVQQKLADLVVHAKTQTPSIDLEMLKKELLDVFASDPYSYAPQKTIDAIKNYTEKVGTITTTSAGTKLKQLARIK
jgi:hypothetical protein